MVDNSCGLACTRMLYEALLSAAASDSIQKLSESHSWEALGALPASYLLFVVIYLCLRDFLYVCVYVYHMCACAM